MSRAARIACWALVISVHWRNVPAGPVKVPVQALELAPEVGPGVVAGGLDNADQQQSEPAQQHVGAYPVLQTVVDGPQIDDRLHVPPAPFHLKKLLVSQGDVLSAQLRVGGAQEVLAVQVLLGAGGGAVDPQQAAGSDAQIAVQAGLGGQLAAQFG